MEHPLLLGGALAGATSDVLAAYSAYGLAVGEAFQLRDDVLGVFGDPAHTGKPAGDDLREGKRTVLVAMALEAASPAEVDVIGRYLGDPHLDLSGVEKLREVLVGTGALARVETLIDELTTLGARALDGVDLADGARATLLDLIDAATVRRV